MNKTLKVMTSAALLAGVVAPVAVDTVSANSKNHVDKVPNVADNYKSPVGTPISTLRLQEDLTGFTSGDSFRLILPTGVKFQVNASDNYVGVPTNAVVTNVTDQVLELRITGVDGTPSANSENITIPLHVDIDGAVGELKVTVDPMDTTLTGGSYTFGVVNKGKTTAVVETNKTIGKTGKVGTIRIDETSVNAIGEADGVQQKVTLKLQPGVEWNFANDNTALAAISFGGGLTGSTAVAPGAGKVQDGRTLEFYINTQDTRSQRGSIFINTPELKIDGAQKGDIEVSIAGTNITDQDLVLAKYGEWDGAVKVEEVKELIAGRDETDEDQKTALITIEETVPGSFIDNREIEVELPSWVKVRDVKNKTVSNITNIIHHVDGNKNKFSFEIDGTNGSARPAKVEFKLQLSIEGNKTGDIEAIVKGAGVSESKAVIAKAVSPVVVDKVDASQVKIGLQEQSVPDFVFGEVLKGTFDKDYAAGDENIRITLPQGVTWSAVPTVEVIEGNLEIDKNSVTRLSGNNRVLLIPVKSEGTKPSKIKVSNAKITVDRTVPEGKINASIGGGAVVKNFNTSATAGQFITDIAASFELATTVTPAPADTTAAKEVTFTIGGTSYTIGDKTAEMDVAPFVEAGRTYLPVRYVAEAVGVAPENILFDNATRTVTIIKGQRMAQAKLGSNILTVDGMNIPMDVQAKVVNGRTPLLLLV